jgi:dethiobiotin synthetase
MKPICCGDRQNAELLLAAGIDGVTIDDINPVWLKTPAAPLVAVAYNRLGCLNHAVLTVQSILRHGLRRPGLILNDARKSGDIASLTNADFLKQILGVPLFGELGENLTQLPADWRFMFHSVACHVDTGL